MCEWFDMTCGDLMDHIQKKNLNERTLFIYVCDNGWIQDPDRPDRFAPRSKTSPYEMGIRTPIMLRWEGVIKPAMDSDNLVSSIDIATTLLDICGITPADNMQGINLLDSRALSERKEIFCETYAHDFTSVDSSLHYRIIITNPWKLILPDNNNKSQEINELYDLFRDPHEESNFAQTHPGVVEDLASRIERWWTDSQ
jgi:arylsulfatase A-like enzyme